VPVSHNLPGESNNVIKVIKEQ